MAYGLKRLRSALVWMAGGLAAGLSVGFLGAAGAAFADSFSHAPTAQSGALFAIAVMVPFVVCYGVAVVLLLIARRRLIDAMTDSSLTRLQSARSSLRAAQIVIAIGLVPNGYLVLFSGLGAMGLSSGGGFIGVMAGWAAQVPPIVGAIIAIVQLIRSRRATRVPISDDRRWWWDGSDWKPLDSAADVAASASEAPLSLQTLGSRARKATRRSVIAVGVGAGLALIAAFGGVVGGGQLDARDGVRGTSLEVGLVLLVPSMLVAMAVLVLLLISLGSLGGKGAGERNALLKSRPWLKASRVVLWCSLPVTAYLAFGLAFTPLMVTSQGELAADLAGDVAQWLLLAAEIVALVLVFRAVRVAAMRISKDGRLWWNGATWQPFVETGAAAPVR